MFYLLFFVFQPQRKRRERVSGDNFSKDLEEACFSAFFFLISFNEHVVTCVVYCTVFSFFFVLLSSLCFSAAAPTEGGPARR